MYWHTGNQWSSFSTGMICSLWLVPLGRCEDPAVSLPNLLICLLIYHVPLCVALHVALCVALHVTYMNYLVGSIQHFFMHFHHAMCTAHSMNGLLSTIQWLVCFLLLTSGMWITCVMAAPWVFLWLLLVPLWWPVNCSISLAAEYASTHMLARQLCHLVFWWFLYSNYHGENENNPTVWDDTMDILTSPFATV